ncbi:MAG: VPLPA-CTERM sorting domain-containing protein [Gammaproteobacteria bacterium]
MKTSTTNKLVAAVALLVAALPFASWAAPADPAMFAQSGTVSVTLAGNGGLFDHILELASTTGPIISPLLVASDPAGQNSATVTGYPVNNIGDTVALGSYVGGTEMIFRLSNFCCNPTSTLGTQLFTGPGSRNFDGNVYANVTTLDSTHLRVGFEDLDPTRHTYNNLVFDVTLQPVPLPAAAWLFGSGLFGLVGMARRKATIAS